MVDRARVAKARINQEATIRSDNFRRYAITRRRTNRDQDQISTKRDNTILSEAGPLARLLGDPSARFSTYQKVSRTTEWVVRFIRRIQRQISREGSRCPVEIIIPLQEEENRTIQVQRLTANELSEAESWWWIRLTLNLHRKGLHSVW